MLNSYSIVAGNLLSNISGFFISIFDRSQPTSAEPIFSLLIFSGEIKTFYGKLTSTRGNGSYKVHKSWKREGVIFVQKPIGVNCEWYLVLQNIYLYSVFEVKWAIAHNTYWISVYLLSSPKAIKSHKVF